jgi:hypothetical protein
MTLQDDLARHWFQPLVPMEAQKEQALPTPGPMTTRFTGELSPDDARIPAYPKPTPEPSRLEVTQPYIPAVREQPPNFAKRLNTDAPPTVRTAAVAPPSPPPAPSPPAPPPTPPQPEPASRQPAAPPASPPKRRSLARRVIRRIIGPDLLRKDPPKRR